MSANTIIQRFVISVLALILLAIGPVGAAGAQQVKVTAADPASAVQGTVSLDVTVSGSGFNNSAAVRFLVTGTGDTGGIAVKRVTVKSSKQLIATIEVADGAQADKFDIEVALSDGRKGKGTTLFSVLRKTVTEPDPCVSSSPDYVVNWAGFPAFAYVVNDWGTGTYQVRVASRNGVCSKRVGDIQTGRAGSTSFASSGPGQFVIAWGTTDIMIARFNVPDIGETETMIPATVTVFRSDDGAWPADLSPDATSLVYVYGSEALYPSVQIRVASLADATGSSDAVIQTLNGSDSVSAFWAPWDKIYYNELDTSKTRKLLEIDPYGSAAQVPQVLLQFSGSGPLVVNQLFQFGRISGGYAGYDANGPIPNVVFQAHYTTGIKQNGRSGSGCVSVYAIDANTHAFTLGSMSAPSPIIGFNPSVTADATVLHERSTAPASGTTCTSIGYIGEGGLVAESVPLVTGQTVGTWPAALKTR